MKRSFPHHIFSKKVELKQEFSGSSPPAIFVGAWGYPKVFTGFLSPTNSFKEAAILDSPETWYKEGLKLKQVLSLREQMIYSRFTTSIKKPSSRLNEMQKELVQSIRPCDLEIKLKKMPRLKVNHHKFAPPIPSPVEIEKAQLTENPKIPKKIDKIVSDTDLKAVCGLENLYKNKISITQIQKILSAGLLGLKHKRIMVPTKWSITATDSTLSKNMLTEIRNYPEISEFLLFSNTYLGNHYQILLIPRYWSYQLIEIGNPGTVFSQEWIDWESYAPRKTYATNCVGGYYAARLGICEYLTKIQRQATIFVVRETDPSYNTPLGVWVPRETVRGAFQNPPEKFNSLEEAFKTMKRRTKTPWHKIEQKSDLLKEMKTQRRLKDFI
jgi:DNA repair protein NreA